MGNNLNSIQYENKLHYKAVEICNLLLLTHFEQLMSLNRVALAY